MKYSFSVLLALLCCLTAGAYDFIAGDIAYNLNGDGNVNAGDVSELYSAILRGAADATYDLNTDGNVNAGDISTLYSIILGQ